MANSIIFSNVDRLLKEKKIKKMDFYRDIDVTPEGWKYLVDNDTMKTQMLMRIAEVLEVSAASLLEIHVGENVINEPEVKWTTPNEVLYEVLKSLRKSVTVIEEYLQQKTIVK